VWVILALAIVVAGLTYMGWKQHQNLAGAAAARFGGQQPLVPVLAGTVQEKDVPVYLEGLGTVQAYNTVTVRVRVDGELKQIAFTEGQDVKAGDLLAVIDPAPYQAVLDQANAKKAEDQAQLVNAQVNLKRETELIAAKIDSQQVYDTQKALADQLEATVKADQAAIESAEVNLNYTRVTSPIAGHVGIRLMDQGNMVHATDSNGIVVITQLQPISLIFTLPEQDLGKIQREMSASSEPMKVLAIDRENNDVLDEGTLAVIDNQIDTSTGTIKLKANFPNQKNHLWPGQFVNPRLLLTVRKNGLVVPTAAIQRGPNGPYVFVIKNGSPPGAGKSGGQGKRPQSSTDAPTSASPASMGQGSKNNTDDTAQASQKAHGGHGNSGGDSKQPPMYAKVQPVTVAPEVSGAESLITAGLQKGDLIVVDGQYKLQDGSAIRIVPADKASAVDSRSSESQ
jgi:multidrug efflux system membrane fusion protein